MKLYKNVPIEDLENILKNGILPISVTNNDNWESGKRADNPIDLVYLFNSLSKQTTFTHYGVALLEIEIPSNKIIETVIRDGDSNKGLYKEYIATKVESEYISTIFLPKILKKRIKPLLTKEILKKVYWCKVTFKNHISDEMLSKYVNTANLFISRDNYLRGISDDNTFIDLEMNYIIKYKFDKNNYTSDFEKLTDPFGLNFISFGKNPKNFYIKSQLDVIKLYIVEKNCKLPKNYEVLETFEGSLQIFGEHKGKKLIEFKGKKIELIKVYEQNFANYVLKIVK